MSEVLIYSQDSCPYCTELKGLLDTNGIPYRVMVWVMYLHLTEILMN